jgi:uncharacterized SAM-binding protein YcdF (DUF218 family)
MRSGGREKTDDDCRNRPQPPRAMSLLHMLASVLTLPLIVATLLAIAAIPPSLVGRRRTAWVLLGCAASLAYLASTIAVGSALLRPLESRYPPLAPEQAPTVGYVVVLGSSYRPHDGIPASAALDEDGLARAVEAVCLVRRLPAARLVVSGGAAPPGSVAVARGYARLARALGVPEQSILLSEQPLDTRSEARELVRLLGSAPFLLVTSAYHMPRAMLLMQRAGAHPIAAPTGQRAFGTTPMSWRDFLPGSRGLGYSERALHEYAGLLAIAVGLQ